MNKQEIQWSFFCSTLLGQQAGRQLIVEPLAIDSSAGGQQAGRQLIVAEPHDLLGR